MKLGQKRGKLLGGAPPGGSRRREARGPARPAGALLVALALGFFALGGVAGYGWALDRQVRGGILRQRAVEARRPDWTSLRSLPRYVPEAFLAVRQPSLLRTGRVRPGRDADPIARELVREVHMLPNTPIGELKEVTMGPVLERHLTPEALTELYLNRVYLGRSWGVPVYGVWAAAHEYFGKEPEQLTLSEAATLAGLLLPPRIDDPHARIGAVGARRSEVLEVLLRGELITPEQFREALAEPLGFQPGLEQLPMSRPADWGIPQTPIRLPPNLRPTPPDSTSPPEAGR